ncbi:MAG TPA: class I SAM-dependent methyltransferase, partial [Acidimicrobiales bacterium]|nr:class I SAM-dependent methyltransferase [Acidimicrobiales bacterium]
MIEGRPSVTAQRLAAHRLGFERVPTRYGNAAADMALATDVAGWPQHGMPAGRMHDYLRARTTFFDRVVVSSLERGFSQVVVGAAGYDGRALRYAKPGVTWFEVDLPSTQQDKLARLRRLEIGTEHVRFVEADFASDPVAERLLAAGLRP